MLKRCRVAVKRMEIFGVSAKDGDSNTDWYSLIESDALFVLSV